MHCSIGVQISLLSELTVNSRIKKWPFYIYISAFSCHSLSILHQYFSSTQFCSGRMEEIPDDCDSIYCGGCRTRVAFIEDVFVTVWNYSFLNCTPNHFDEFSTDFNILDSMLKFSTLLYFLTKHIINLLCTFCRCRQ